MTQMLRSFRRVILSITLIFSGIAPVYAHAAQTRITGPIDNSNRAAIRGSRPAGALAANDVGKVPSDMKLQGMTVVFSLTPAQRSDLDSLIAAQQNPSSPLYHQWLTPDQFAARFGMAADDISQVQGWLQQQGFTPGSVSRSRDRITFSGTEAQVESAFGTELHYYKSGSETRFAPATDISIPAALASTVSDVINLSNFRLRPRLIAKPNQAVQPNFTSSQSGGHFLTPKDVATIYDINPAYNAGYTGANQSIAVVGQSFVYASDVTNFQNAAGLTPKAPTLLLVPDSGTAAIFSGDEAESDLDLEYSGGIAKGANIFFVYTGNNTNYGVFDSLQYAIDERLAPIISISYGACEPAIGTADLAQLEVILAQAASQGQSVISAAGDDGSTDCYAETGVSLAVQQELSVDYPSSSQYSTGLGGTEFPAADVVSTNSTYFTATNGSDIISSAISYIPEQVWNDDSVGNLSSGGGGISTYSPRPSWQTGVPGIPAGSFRLVPDISLDASPNNAGYLYCSSDTTETGITGSCSNGFRDASDTNLTIAGGTSFAAPIFSGMLAIISQKVNSVGQGVVNPTLYALAANSATYASAFHDITSGNNECIVANCSTAGESEYPATTGYDEASGLGSVDLYNLLTAWPTTTGSALVSTTTTLSAATLVPASGASDTITITVTPTSGTLTLTPIGTVSIDVDGNPATPAIPLVNGTATYSFSSPTGGAHVVTVNYSGDVTYAPSTAAIALNVGATTSTGAFVLTATNLTVASGSSGTSTLTITPSGGYTGTVNITASTSANLSDACYTVSSVTVPGTAAVTAALTIYTSASSCSSIGAVGINAMHRFKIAPGLAASTMPVQPMQSPYKSAPLGAALAGLVVFGCFRKRSQRLRKLQPLLAIALLGIVGIALSGCGDGGTTPLPNQTSNNQAKGAYAITLVGIDTVNPAITSSTSITLTVD